MPYGNAPSAFDVSSEKDPPPPPKQPVTFAPTIRQENISKKRTREDAATKSTISRKPKNDAGLVAGPPKAKRARIGKYYTTKYAPPCNVRAHKETKELILLGELDKPDTGESADKPVRHLDQFSFYDKSNGPTLAPIHFLDNPNKGPFYASGYALPVPEADEDEGQENDDDDADPEQERVYLNLSKIVCYSFDYSNEDSTVWLETEQAWYKLQSTSTQYRPLWEPFFRELYVAKKIIRWSMTKSRDGTEAFLSSFILEKDPFGERFSKETLFEAKTQLIRGLESHEDCDKLVATPLIRSILGDQARGVKKNLHARRAPPTSNLDNFYLRPENQEQTHVTPNIAILANGWFQETLKIAERQQAQAVEHVRLSNCVRKCNEIPNIRYKGRGHDGFYDQVTVSGIKCCVGDVVVLRPDSEHMPKFPTTIAQIPPGAELPDFFWFGKIIWIREAGQVHVQWLQHGSLSVLDEFGASSKSLFLLDMCSTIPLQSVHEKVTVRFQEEEEGEYHCLFKYHPHDASFTSTAPTDLQVTKIHIRWQSKKRRPRRSTEAGRIWFIWRGSKYHSDDFVLYHDPEHANSPGQIGKIVYFQTSSRVSADPWPVTIQVLERIGNLRHLPENELRDERHLFITDATKKISSQQLLKIIMVFPFSVIKQDEFDAWIAASPLHFYINYHFPSRESSWDQRTEIDDQEFHVCQECVSLDTKRFRSLQDMVQRKELLPTLDLFAGIGAFGGGMAKGSGVMKVTHAIEISPSAALTYQKNYPDVKVHNQCANRILKYWYRYWRSEPGNRPSPPEQLYDKKENVPRPPKKGQIKVIVAGFPCQSHSTLNMFKSESDRKSNLILPTLSFVELLQPDYCFFENVPGFLQYRLNATQVSPHKVKGGIERGGLKLVLRALLDMGYQVRFGQLQAAHYGTPQRRERFFLCAAKRGLRLPEFPQPTHNYPDARDLSIKNICGIYGRETTIQCISNSKGIAPHSYVSVRDAIEDLPAFDYRHPGQQSENQRAERETRKENGIKEFDSGKLCGRKKVAYKHAPSTRFQVEARRDSEDDQCLQHYTRPQRKQIAERILAVPLRPNADYRSFDAKHQQSYMMFNPVSANGKGGFKKGMFGRIDASGVFQTTVTNVGPTAKQSYVLHPWCHRMVTVRELARSQGLPDSFEFVSLASKDEKIDTIQMLRQIGNAVPWQVAMALGRELQASILEDWEEHEREDD
ncbi:S-adenosyl-L-methionine-dependent methyltransferase [Hymenopellis radicata]|nr:S-adenosyl-L-methionine-dependent methyltransferase [Hymenopellis radicata]